MDSKCLLHRQIHPSFVIDGIVSNQAFIEYSVSSGAIASKNQKSIKAAKLRDYAVNRGWTYKII